MNSASVAVAILAGAIAAAGGLATGYAIWHTDTPALTAKQVRRIVHDETTTIDRCDPALTDCLRHP